jgi:multidrug efflux system membrane fusion protein
LVVPTQALEVAPTKNYVYVVKPDKTVEERTITTNGSADGVSVISSGLQENEQVVVDGQIRLTNGSVVVTRPMAVVGAAPGGS